MTAQEIDWASAIATVMQARQTILPKRLMDPGPDEAQLQQILQAASSAPDHGQLLPWRFVRVPQSSRAALAAAFGAALRERDPLATDEQVAQAQEKAFRAPCLMLLVLDAERGDPTVDGWERTLSAGCAVQNMLLMATAMGFGSALTSGKGLKSSALRTLFGLHAGEHALCFVSIGTVHARKPTRVRPTPGDYSSTLSVEEAPPASGSGA
jgi:nitroreductase